MAPKKEVEFSGVLIKNHRSWFVTLEFPPPTKAWFPLSQGSHEKLGNLLGDQGNVRGENFYLCKLLT